MPKFVIEREMPGFGARTPAELAVAAQKSSLVMRELGGEISWITSYVTDDKVYCVFVAPNEEVVMEHARCLDMPVDRISRVRTAIDASTGDQAPRGKT